MAPKQPNKRGMAGFVHSMAHSDRNETPGGRNEPNSDIKVRVPRTTGMQAANIAQQRSYRPAGAPNAAANPRPIVKQEPETQEAMLDTDYSSVDEFSDVPSDQQHPQAARGRPIHSVHLDQMQRREPSPGYSAIESDREREPELDGNGVASENASEQPSSGGMPAHLMRADDAMKAVMSAGVPQLGYTEGDSYPSTTSGPPSVYEPPDRHHAAANRGLDIIQNALPTRQAQRQAVSASRPKQSNTRPTPQANQGEDFQALAAPQGSKIQRPDNAAKDALGAQFSFAPVQPGARANSQAPLASLQTRGMTASRSRESINTVRAQQASITENGPAMSQNSQLMITAPEQQTFHSPAQAQTPGNALPQTNSAPAKAVPPADQIAPSKQPEASSGALGNDASKQKAPAEEELKLDYNKNELFIMEYADLKSQPFDHGPQEQPPSPGSNNNRSMEDRMEDASQFNRQQQHDFFASLPIDEWEEAGDWFLGQFGGVLTKLKSLRREKRDVALGFEQQIESRHLAVEKKRKFTEDALKDMRTSGNLVLTPKKARKSS